MRFASWADESGLDAQERTALPSTQPDDLEVHSDSLEILDAALAPARPIGRMLMAVGVGGVLVAIGIKILLRPR